MNLVSLVMSKVVSDVEILLSVGSLKVKLKNLVASRQNAHMNTKTTRELLV